jgi:hypothetical protein
VPSQDSPHADTHETGEVSFAIRPKIAPPKLTPEEIPVPEPKKFYVTLELVWWKDGGWKKVWDIDTADIVIVDCTKKTTVRTFVAKCKEQHDIINPGKMWRVFFASNMPERFVWLFDWEKRKDYLVDFTDGDKTLEDIGIGPNSNHLLYFFQTQFKTRDEQ